MKLIKNGFKDLIENKRLTFLIGAGCSIDKPSSLPSGEEMMDAIIEFSCHEAFKDDIDILVKKKELRFEQLVEIFMDLIDNDLQCVKYFSKCSDPNSIHFFLAKMIQKGHFVMTTNFDSLIEHALIKIGIPKDQILPIITKEEFEAYKNPYELYEKSLFPVYKIHGSPLDIIKNTSWKELRKSLIVTTRSLSENKRGVNIFELEPFKQEAFNSLLKNRTLVVMGYSGNDDFDIIPSLLSIKDINEIIWISHSDNTKPNVYVVDLKNNTDQLEKEDKIIYGLKQTKKEDNIFKIEGLTKNILSQINLYEEIEYSSEFSLNPSDWINNHVRHPTKIEKIQMCYKIFELNNLEKSFECTEKLIDIAIEEGEPYWQSVGFFNKANIYRIQGNMTEALIYYDKSLVEMNIVSKQKKHLIRIHIGKAQILGDQGQLIESHKMLVNALNFGEEMKDAFLIAQIHNSLGNNQRKFGNLDESENHFKLAISLFEKLNSLIGKAVVYLGWSVVERYRGKYEEELGLLQLAANICKELHSKFYYCPCLTELGNHYNNRENYKMALECYNKALEIALALENNQSRAELLGSIGRVFLRRGYTQQSLEKFNESLQINEKYGYLQGKTANLEDIACVYEIKGDFSSAINNIKQALEINKKIGNYHKIVTSYINLGNAYKLKGNSEIALNIYQEASDIIKKVDNPETLTVYHIKIAKVWIDLKKFDEAIKELKSAEVVGEKLLTKYSFIEIYSCYGVIREIKGNPKKAIFYYKKSLELSQKFEVKREIAIKLNKLGLIYKRLGNFEKSLEHYEKALQIARKLGDYWGIAIVLYDLGYIKNKKGEYKLASEYLLEARKIIMEHKINDKELQNNINKAIEIVKGNIKAKK